MKKILLFLFFVLMSTTFYAQTVTLTFTGNDVSTTQYVQLDRVVINNLTQNWQETIYWPDTVLTMQVGTGINEVGTNTGAFLQLSQSNPNPFNGITYASLIVGKQGEVRVEITDVTGRLIGVNDFSFEPGAHQLRVTLSTAGMYFLTAKMNGQTSSVKMVNKSEGGKDAIEDAGYAETQKSASPKTGRFASKGPSTNPFQWGDQMEYVGYATIDGTEKEGEHIIQLQNSSQSFTLQFVTSSAGNDGQPCPGAATVTDIDNNTYNTVRIGDQCWMKENLRTTRYADGTTIALGSSTSTTTKYRYYPNNDESNVATYGYLYNWNAVMGASSSSSANPSGVQGICPDGWHVPSNAEFHQLKYFVSSRSQYVCGDDNTYIAKALASVEGWNSSSEQCAVGNNSSTNNMTGFSALPAGIRFAGASFFGDFARFWSSTKMPENSSLAFYMQLSYDKAFVLDDEWMYGGNAIVSGHSVRCVRN